MDKVYKIHPAIGIARIGPSVEEFFVGPERPGDAGVDISKDGTESAVVNYKDSAGNIKRQAARFRVFEYDKDAAGRLTLVGEVTPDKAEVEWNVMLVNRKAALRRSVLSTHEDDPNPPAAGPRNPGVDLNLLIIEDTRPHKISKANRSGVRFDEGKFHSVKVFLGELKTDAKGRLLVLGGRGKSESFPANPPAALNSFANNNKWYDDVADGPVTATLKFPDNTTQNVQFPAWVICAPPDFAPGITGIVTLYDVGMQAAYAANRAKPAKKPSFKQHIQPVIERLFNLRWVHRWDTWNTLKETAKELDNPSVDPQSVAQKSRNEVFKKIIDPGIDDFVLPEFMKTYFEAWKNGDFVTGAADVPPPPLSTPEELDRAALEACVGANFFPGIEATAILRDIEIYSDTLRLDHTRSGKVFPGCMTEIMALPWQADFHDCRGSWWPSHAPISP